MATVARICAIIILCAAPLAAREFTVLAYNVENLFDVDGVALFEDYIQDEAEDPFTYSNRKLYTKLSQIAGVLEASGDGLEGAGPDIVLFQELEADFTPESGIDDYGAFLETHSGQTVFEMLVERWRPEYGGIPSEAWLLKALADRGLEGYEVVVSPAPVMESGMAHTNAIFTRFPLLTVRHHPIPAARAIIEAEIEVDGHRLWVYVNHWKSGASSRTREPIRVKAARVLRGLIDARLAEDPQADIIVAGDLNSHYNHALLFPGIETGINAVLGSHGDEAFEGEVQAGLYNFWYELPPAERYSDVWKGKRGSLMHLMGTRGLYDQSGISYVDGSFERVIVVGLNADAMLRPLRWNFAGDAGGGASDHFPVSARFSTEGFRQQGSLSTGQDALDYELTHRYDPEMHTEHFDGSLLHGPDAADLGSLVGKQFDVEGRIIGVKPLWLQVGQTKWAAYAPDPAIYSALLERENAEDPVRLIVTVGIWKGASELVVEAIR